MSQIKKEDVKQEVFDLYDDYAHNRVDRRGFLEKLSLYAVGGLTVPALMSFLMPDYSGNVQVKADDPRLQSGYINYPSPKGGGTIKGLLSKPVDAKKKLGGIIVVHENRGLNPYIEDVARRAALAGFVSLAPDALTPLGGYPGNDDDGRTLQSKRDPKEMQEDFISAFDYLKTHPDCNGKVGVVGFCFGGGIANMMAVRVPGLAASVPFYGSQPAAEDVPKITAPLMLHYASLDTRITAGWPAYETALKQNHKKYEAFIYEGVNHGFHNDTTPRYDKAAAELAWKRTLDFFKASLA
ncbi:dienelactone hydrolase family protein [Mucilaginibacter phyllosphaerae]|uniref:Carboxymethylenebutenolidase n=1 Tax=Mucilaginibacter phyllosphaerae TaxID=1812349 RepID=A0A4Y8ADC3_9SPHI|nr:dienelactone hydrolase family protein [Mucilaginibacter phyllosphaerae]MBB3970277.1 carboxymethylenebutenolidase [Mucilaginibacter phyllosphaerae]TEW66654.1 dienelactone hydrolase family protein [Mucilaginibacter phyllosphaerae]GGH10988.1 dienelactone hydrolase [Mucilaginibacter phyllosphaerae]